MATSTDESTSEAGQVQRDVLRRVDARTGQVRHRIESALSVQERKVLVEVARCNDADKFSVSGAFSLSGIDQRNHFSAIIGRLVGKGFLVRRRRGVYDFADQPLREHLRYRHTRSAA